jgi:subtilisin family serine protease
MKPLRPFLSAAVFLGACAPAAQIVSAPSPSSPAAPVAVSAAFVPPDTSPANWWLLDEATDHYPGISAEKAYRELLANRPTRRNVVVAVIDGGSDLDHPDLAAKAWTNAREVPGAATTTATGTWTTCTAGTSSAGRTAAT